MYVVSECGLMIRDWLEIIMSAQSQADEKCRAREKGEWRMELSFGGTERMMYLVRVNSEAYRI